MRRFFIYSLLLVMMCMSGIGSVQAASRPTMNVAYTDASMRFVAWQYAAIPASDFLKGATKAEITVKGAVFVAFGYSNGPWNFADYADGVFNWSNDNVNGVTYTIQGEVLQKALQGELYVRTDKSDGLTMIVKNIGSGAVADEPVVEEPEEEAAPALEYTSRLNEWNDIQMPASAFVENATSAKISVTGASYVKISNKVNGNLNTVKEFSWSGSNQNGVNYEVAGDVLAAAKKGNLYIYVGGGSPINLSIVNTVSNDEPVVEPDEPVVEPDEPVVEPDEPIVEPDEPVVEPDEPIVEPDEPIVEPDEPVVEPDEPIVEPDEPIVEPDEPVVEPDEPVVEPDEPVVEPDEPVVEPDEPADTPVYGLLNSYQMTLWEWNNIQIPASAFDAKAEDIKVVISGASYVKYMIGQNVIAEYPWSDNTKFGAILQLNAEQKDAALKGNLYTWVGGGSPITLVVSCYGMGGKPEPLRDPSTLDMMNFGDRSYAIAHKYQLTDVPTLYLTIPDAVGKDINSVLFKDRSTNTAEYHNVTIQVVDKSNSLENFTDDAEIKVRGNSTAECMKKPYRIKFPKKHKHDLLGLGYDKRNWVLLANFLDPAMIRNAMSYYIGQEVGEPFCPGYKFVDVVINDEYRGTYQITDQIEVGKNRIDVDETDGWYVEVSRIDMIEDPCLVAGSLPISIKNPEPDAAAEIAVLKNEVADWFDNVSKLFFSYNQSVFTDPQTGWRAYFDEESLVDYYLAVNLGGDYDGFMTVKMYREPDGKMFVGPLWDKDLSAGNYEDGTKLIEEHNNGQFVNYLNVLLKDPVFVKKIHDKLHAMVNDGIDKALQDYVGKIDAEIAMTEPLNSTKWAGYSSWKLSFNTHADAIKQLRDYYTKRIPFLVEKIDAKYQALGGNNIRGAKQIDFEATDIAGVAQSDVTLSAGKGTLTVAANGGKDVPVYGISGVKVAVAASGKTISLPAGTYIVAGNKVVVK